MAITNIFSNRIPYLKWVTGGYVTFLLGLSLLADFKIGKSYFRMLKIIPDGDKVLHFFLIGLLAFFINQNMNNKTVKLWSVDLMVGSLIVSGIFTLEEFSQLFLTYRSFSFADMFANYAGIFLFGKLSLLKQYFETKRASL